MTGRLPPTRSDSDAAELDLILGKLLDVSLRQHRLRLERYERDLGEFEQRYSMVFIRCLLRKAQALRVAVQRGLRAALQP